jgi:hypothetical protein
MARGSAHHVRQSYIQIEERKRRKMASTTTCSTRREPQWDPKPYAAFRLGFTVWCYGSDVLEYCLLDLFDLIPPTLFQGILQLRVDIDRSCEEFEKNARPVDHLRWHPDSFHLESLRNYASRAIQGANRYRKWFDLGFALGRCYDDRLQNREPDIQAISTAIGNLSNDEIRQPALMQRLVKLDLGNSSFDRWLEQWQTVAVGFNGPALTYNDSGSPIIPLVDAILRDLKSVISAPFQCSPAGDRVEAVDEEHDQGHLRGCGVGHQSVRRGLVESEWENGYLGLQFDTLRWIVKRLGCDEQADLSKAPLYWDLLRKLSDGEDTWVGRPELEMVWQSSGAADKPQRTTIYNAITKLKKMINVLGLTVDSRRFVGWRLMERETSKSNLEPASRARRAAKRRKK